MALIKSLACSVGLLLVIPTLVFSQKMLPVEFDVQLGDRNTATIHWTRSSEDSFDYVLQRSVDAKTWQTIANINWQILPCYDYIDLQLKEGVTYYRIIQRREQQLLAVSDTKWIKTTRPDELYVWPTPAHDILHIRSPYINANLDIIDADGRLVRKVSIIDSITDVPLQALPNGIYFIRLRHANEVLVEKFIKQQGF